MNSFTILVTLADNHPVILDGVTHGLAKHRSISVVGAARNSTELIETLDRCSSDVVVSDYFMPGSDYGDGLILFSLIRQRYPNIKIVVFRVMDNPAALA